MTRVLLVEDDLPKQKQIVDVVRKALGEDAQIHVAKSVNAAIDQLDGEPFDCVLLDMSLPSFNEGESYAAGGRQLDFAGRQILEAMDEMEISSIVFLITQLPDFIDEDGKTVLLVDLHRQLKADFPSLYAGYTYFHHSSDRWARDLREFLGDMT